MKAVTEQPQTNNGRFWPRGVQLATAVPSFLLWTVLSGIALLWYAGVGFRAISGTLNATSDWRFSYLMVMLLLVLIGSAATARTIWKAYEGRSFLWWHVGTFSLGVVFLCLIGIVGD